MLGCRCVRRRAPWSPHWPSAMRATGGNQIAAPSRIGFRCWTLFLVRGLSSRNPVELSHRTVLHARLQGRSLEQNQSLRRGNPHSAPGHQHFRSYASLCSWWVRHFPHRVRHLCSLFASWRVEFLDDALHSFCGVGCLEIMDGHGQGLLTKHRRTVSMSNPASTSRVAHVCRRLWNVSPGSICASVWRESDCT